MEKKIFRLVTVAIVAFLQAYFFASFSFGGYAVSFALMAAIAWTIISGFDDVWLCIVGLGVFVDLLSFDVVGKNVILFILAVYFVSFISKRLLIENRGWSFLLVIFIVIAVTFFNDLFRASFFFWQGGIFAFLENGLGRFFKVIMVESFWNVLIFYFLYLVISRMEERLFFYERAVKIK
jgi:cell shape-determining protein MreD